MQVPIRSLLRVATSTSAIPSLPSRQGKVDSQLAGVPLSAWALSNLVCLASHTVKDNAQFVNGLVIQDYVQALNCLLEDLNSWIELLENAGKMRRMQLRMTRMLKIRSLLGLGELFTSPLDIAPGSR